MVFHMLILRCWWKRVYICSTNKRTIGKLYILVKQFICKYTRSVCGLLTSFGGHTKQFRTPPAYNTPRACINVFYILAAVSVVCVLKKTPFIYSWAKSTQTASNRGNKHTHTHIENNFHLTFSCRPFAINMWVCEPRSRQNENLFARIRCGVMCEVRVGRTHMLTSRVCAQHILVYV